MSFASETQRAGLGNRASALRADGIKRCQNFFEIDFLLMGHAEIVSRHPRVRAIMGLKGEIMKPEKLQRLKELLNEMQGVIDAEQDEVTENTPVVLHTPPITAKDKRRMLDK